MSPTAWMRTDSKAITSSIIAQIRVFLDKFPIESIVTLFPSSLLPRMDPKCTLSRIFRTLLITKIIVGIYCIELMDQVRVVDTG